MAVPCLGMCVISVEHGMLNITRLEQSDAGEYHCTAENMAGRDQRTANIIVLGVYEFHTHPL